MNGDKSCDGPLIWFSAGHDPQDASRELGAVLECASCGYFIATGWFHEERHSCTPVLREGLA